MPTTLECALHDPFGFRCTGNALFDGTNWPAGWLRYFLFDNEVRDFCPDHRLVVLNAVKRNGHQVNAVPGHTDWFKLVKR